MGLIDDDRVVVFQERIGLRLGQQDTVGHQLDRRATRERIGEAHLEADVFAQWRAQFLRNPFRGRGGGDAARLGVANQACLTTPQFQANLGQLGGLARARFAAHDDHLVGQNGSADVGAPPGYRQILGKCDRWQRMTETDYIGWRGGHLASAGCRVARGAGRLRGPGARGLVSGLASGHVSDLVSGEIRVRG